MTVLQQRAFLFFGLLLLLAYAAKTPSSDDDKTNNAACFGGHDDARSWDQLCKGAVLQLGSTVEILLRSFALGFGAHLLQYLLLKNNDATYDELAQRFKVSAVCGVAMACFVFGSSFFIPTHFRMHWFEY
jgi:hypothetical protein